MNDLLTLMISSGVGASLALLVMSRLYLKKERKLQELSFDLQKCLFDCYERLDKCLYVTKELESVAKDIEEKERLSKLKEELMKGEDLFTNKKPTIEQRTGYIECFLEQRYNFKPLD